MTEPLPAGTGAKRNVAMAGTVVMGASGAPGQPVGMLSAGCAFRMADHERATAPDRLALLLFARGAAGRSASAAAVAAVAAFFA